MTYITQHIGIDLGGSNSQICVRRLDGKITEERRIATVGLPAYLQKQPPSRVIAETCSEAFWVADAALSLGHEIRVVPATLSRSLGVGSRRVKTDERDARALSEVSCRIDLPSVHIRTREARELQARCGMRDRLVQARTLLINNVRGWLRTQGRRVRGGAAKSFPERVASRARRDETEVPAYVERQLRSIGQLSQEIAEVNEELTALAGENVVCRRLMTVPGVGVQTALRFYAALDGCERFGGPHAVASYLGLTPGEHSSSEKKRRTSITKAGSSPVRWLLTQAAWCAWRTRPQDPMVKWAQCVAERRGRRVAIIALARKLAGILFAIWRDESVYQAPRAAQTPVPEEKAA